MTTLTTTMNSTIDEYQTVQTELNDYSNSHVTGGGSTETRYFISLPPSLTLPPPAWSFDTSTCPVTLPNIQFYNPSDTVPAASTVMAPLTSTNLTVLATNLNAQYNNLTNTATTQITSQLHGTILAGSFGVFFFAVPLD